VYGDPEVHPQPEEYRGSVNPVGFGHATTKASGSLKPWLFLITGKMM